MINKRSVANNTIANIKSQVSIAMVIGSRVKLTGPEGRTKGLCPFHSEKTPSFNVHDSEGYYHCFGCGAHGDVFDFIVNFEKLEFTDALKLVATEAGIPLGEIRARSADEPNKEIYRVLDLLTSWFSKQLTYNSRGFSALEYIYSRGINEESVALFRIGFCPEGSIDSFITEHGIPRALLQDLGILQGSRLVFAGRIIFPIWDKKGRVIAFGARSISGQNPKYINSCESVVFKKSEHFYGWHLALQETQRKEELLIVEGYIDAIMLRQHGIKNCVASMGTALSSERIRDLWVKIPSVNICFDGDNAGFAAMSKLAREMYPLLTAINRDVFFTIMPSELDPAEAVRIHGEKIFNGLQNLSEMTFLALSREINTDSPNELARLEFQLEELVSSIPHAALRRLYKQSFYDKIRSLSKAKFFKKQEVSETSFEEVFFNLADQVCVLEIFWVITYPEVLRLPGVEEDFIEVAPVNPELAEIKKFLLEAFHRNPSLHSEELRVELCDRFDGKLLDCIFALSARLDEVSVGDMANLLGSVVKCWRELRIRDESLERSICKARDALMDPNNGDGLDDLLKHADLIAKFKNSVEELKKLMKAIIDVN